MKNKKFTLIELIVVIVVLGILAAIVIPNINSYTKEAEATALVSDARMVELAVDRYSLDNDGATPTEDKTPVKVGETPELIDLTLLESYFKKQPKNKSVTFYLNAGGVVTTSKDIIKDEEVSNLFDTVTITSESLNDGAVAKLMVNPTTDGSGIKSIKMPNGVVIEGNTAEYKTDKEGIHEFVVTYEDNKTSKFTYKVENLESPFIYTTTSTLAVIKGYRGVSTDIELPSEIEGKPVKTIASYALYPISKDQTLGNSTVVATSVVIPNTVTMIQTAAFKDNELTSVTLSDNITSLPNDAFANNKLTEIVLPSNLMVINRNVFKGNDLKTLLIPSKVTMIAQEAFYLNPNLKEVTAPAALDLSLSIDSNPVITRY